MILSRMLRALAGVSLLSLLAITASNAQTKKKKGGPSRATADEILKVGPRPKKAPLPPSELPLKFVKGERIAIVGNSLAERMNLFGNFEAMLHYRHPDLELVVRNFARPADEVGIRQRSTDYTKLDDPLYAFNPDTFLCFFGFNESFAGPDGVEKFKADYEKFIDDYTKKYPRDDAGSPPRFILISPSLIEQNAPLIQPQYDVANSNLDYYKRAIEDISSKHKCAYVDCSFAQSGIPLGTHFTINGVHLNKLGDQYTAIDIDWELNGKKTLAINDTQQFEKLRQAVVDKAWVNQQDHRMLNGWYVYGGRRTYDTETFPREYAKIRKMCEVRDRYVWDIAQGKQVPDQPDDSKTGELFVPETRFGAPDQKNKSEAELIYLNPDDFIKSCTVPEGFEVKLFADEKRFPEIAKPVQMNFDNKGRLWISTMPSYPQWKPGDPKPADKLVILEDTDGDGVADKSTVFYDKLHCPTGFEFYNGGVLVTDQPRLIFLKDTDGDDKVDLVVHLLDGWASDDTHHSIGAFEWSHGGYLKMLEGVSMSTAVETPWGPFRNQGTSGCYTLDPRSLKLSHYNTPGYGNPWCYVYNDWGQGIVGDGTGAKQDWDTLLSGAQYQGRRAPTATIDPKGMRPVVGSDFLRTRQFPKEMHDQFIFACVINMNGLTRFDFKEDGSGYRGTRTKDLLSSPHKHFRPVDPQVGPDGAVWFGDWANALIGHMQYSQRDPNRNHDLGRIYRLVNTKKPLLTPVTQHGKTELELLDQLKEYENRTRYRARRELWARPWDKVKPAVETWLKAIFEDPKHSEKHICEALWVLQGHRQVPEKLLQGSMKHFTDVNARAAVVKIVADERDRLPNAKEILLAAAVDPSPRVRIEAVRGLSFFRGADCTDAVLACAKMPMDGWMKYMVQSTLGATQASWATRFLTKQIGQDRPTKLMLEEIMKSAKAGGQAVPHLALLLGSEPASAEQKNKAMSALSTLPGGDAARGKVVFRNAGCIACHKFGTEGQDYGPELTHVMSQPNRSRMKLVESIIDPNAEVDEKFRSTKVEKADGSVVNGLLISKPGEFPIVIFDGKDKKTISKDDYESMSQTKQSSMPEGLAGTISPAELLDLIQFLASLK